MRLTVVGCAGSFPTPDSAASCYLVEADDANGRTWRVLLDLGSGALGPLQTYVDVRGLDAVLLSHLHPDHCLDLCGLYVAMRYDPRGAPGRKLAVHGPTGTLERLAAAYGGEEGGDLETVYDVSTWVEGTPVGIGPITVVPRRVEHPVEAYGLRIEQRIGHRTDVLAYTGDTDTCPALMPLAAGADLLLAEASFVEGRDDATRGVHLTGRRAGELAAAAGVRRLVLTHLPVWTPPAVVLQEARDAYPGPVDVARPGMVHLL